MKNRKFTNYKKFYIFFNILARELNKYFKRKKNKKFKISNKKKSNFEFDPVTNFDKACEKFIQDSNCFGLYHYSESGS